MANLSVLIGGDDRELQAALKRAQSGMRKFGGEVRNGINDLGKWTAAAAAVGGAIAVHLINEARTAIDVQAKLAAQFKTSVPSIAVLTRASDRAGVSMEQINTAARTLTVNIGKAQQGVGAQADALNRIGLSAERLIRLPLDERLEAVNGAIARNIPLSEQAAVAADLFGSRAGLALANLDPESIRRAREETELFGNAISDLDAARVEEANDSFANISLAMDGLTKQLAVRFSPLLQKIGDEFFNAAKEAGGMGTVADRVFNGMITGAGFVLDAVDGVKRVFELAANSILAFWASVNGEITSAFRALLEIIDSIPGIDLSETLESVRRLEHEGISVALSAMEELGNILDRPMPSTWLQSIVAEAEKASAAAAEATVKARRAVLDAAPDETGGPFDGPDISRTSEDALEKLRDEFRSKEELQFQHHEKLLEQIAAFEADARLTEDEAQALREQSDLQHWERISEIKREAGERDFAIEKARNDAIKQARATFMENLSGLMNTQSRRVFEFGKKTAIGEAIVKGSQAVMDAWQAGMSTGGPWAPLIAAGYATAAAANSANLINNIRKQTFGGTSNPVAPTQGGSNITGGGAAGGAGGGAAGGSSATTIVNFRGTQSEADLIRRFAELLNQNSRDGGRIIVS